MAAMAHTRHEPPLSLALLRDWDRSTWESVDYGYPVVSLQSRHCLHIVWCEKSSVAIIVVCLCTEYFRIFQEHSNHGDDCIHR